MGDTEGAVVKGAGLKQRSMSFSPGYLISCPGILRILNIILGIICLGLWIPGYPHEFKGERLSFNSQDTTKGYGNGLVRESLNQFTLAAIVICLTSSIVILIGLVVIQQAAVDWNRMNKALHLLLGTFLLISGICGTFGVWQYQENCCHVDMSMSGTNGIMFTLSSEGYSRHCHCYLTRYIGQSEMETLTETILYDATKNNFDTSGFTRRWVFEAHHIYVHVAAVVIVLVNSLLYFLAFIFSKVK